MSTTLVLEKCSEVERVRIAQVLSRAKIWALLIGALLILLLASIDYQGGQAWRPDRVPTVLVVGDFTNHSDFGPDVLSSIRALQDDLSHDPSDVATRDSKRVKKL